MSILEDLLVAIKENTAATLAGNEGREAAIAAAKAVSEKAAGTKAKPAAETKATAPKEDEKPKAETTGDTADTDGPTVDDVNAAIKGYVGGSERTEERDARKKKVLGVLTKFSPEGTAKPNGATLAEDKRAAFIKTVAKWTAEGDLTEAPAEDAASDDDDLLGDD